MTPSEFKERCKHATYREHAGLCATMINSYWAAKGYAVDARVVSVSIPKFGRHYESIYEITSNTSRGYPIDMKAKLDEQRHLRHRQSRARRSIRVAGR